MLRLLKKEIKRLKLVGGYQKVYLLLYVIKHIVIHISLIVEHSRKLKKIKTYEFFT